MSESIKYVLDETRIPKAWYNLAADLPKPLPPILHPGPHNLVGPDDLAPLFPMRLILQDDRQSIRPRNLNSLPAPRNPVLEAAPNRALCTLC